MILRTPNGNPLKVFFLTNAMARVLKRTGVPFSEMSSVETYHDKLTHGEIAGILKMEFCAAKVLGTQMSNPDLHFKNDYQGGMLKDAFNKVDGETLSAAFFNCSKFSFLNAGNNTLLISLDDQEDETIPGWSNAKGTTFSEALLETIYAVHGYMECHHGPIVDPKVGEFTLAYVFKLLGDQSS
jgi:hypothetical protein